MMRKVVLVLAVPVVFSAHYFLQRIVFLVYGTTRKLTFGEELILRIISPLYNFPEQSWLSGEVWGIANSVICTGILWTLLFFMLNRKGST